jgi:large subunit ribosomal protein L23
MGFFNRAKKDAKPAQGKAAEAEAKKEVAAPVYVKRATGESHRVLLRPLVTEKTSAMGAKDAYAFEVAMSANKVEIKRAVKAVYGVDAVAVRVMRVLGKPVRTRAGFVRRSAWRKALVTVKPGQKIDVFAHA